MIETEKTSKILKILPMLFKQNDGGTLELQISMEEFHKSQVLRHYTPYQGTMAQKATLKLQNPLQH